MAVYVTDTHPLLWYARGHYNKLSKKALRIFRDAEHDLGLIFVPVVVLLEISLLLKKGKIQLPQPLAHWAEMLLAKQGFDLAQLDLQVIDEAMQFRFNNDPFDAAIVATAMIRDLPLITKDQSIVEARVVQITW